MHSKLWIALFTGSFILLGNMSTLGQERPPGKRFPGKQPPGGGQRPGDLRLPSKLKVGMAAPDFTLKTKEGQAEVQLSSFRGKRPVILVFGSYT